MVRPTNWLLTRTARPRRHSFRRLDAWFEERGVGSGDRLPPERHLMPGARRDAQRAAQGAGRARGAAGAASAASGRTWHLHVQSARTTGRASTRPLGSTSPSLVQPHQPARGDGGPPRARARARRPTPRSMPRPLQIAPRAAARGRGHAGGAASWSRVRARSTRRSIESDRRRGARNLLLAELYRTLNAVRVSVVWPRLDGAGGPATARLSLVRRSTTRSSTRSIAATGRAPSRPCARISDPPAPRSRPATEARTRAKGSPHDRPLHLDDPQRPEGLDPARGAGRRTTRRTRSTSPEGRAARAGLPGDLAQQPDPRDRRPRDGGCG